MRSNVVACRWYLGACRISSIVTGALRPTAARNAGNDVIALASDA
jgi:hypothetical protein